MSKREILAGATDQTIDILIKDSSSTVGAGLTGLAFNTASLTCYYRKGATGTPTALTLATQTVGGAHSDGGFVAVDGTNCPGQYRLDLSDTIVATAGMVTLHLRGATNMVPCVVEIEVVSVNKFDSVRLGLTALPNAAAEASGGLYTRGTGAGQINQANNGNIDVNAVRFEGSTVAIGNVSTVFGTDFATNYDSTRVCWRSNIKAISDDTTAADNAEAFFDGTGYAGTGNTIPMVTTVTNLTNAAGAGDLTSTMKTSVQTAANAALVALNLDHLFAVAIANVDVVDNSAWAKLHSKSATADYTSYANTTDSLEALRDRGDAAWITATGFSTLDAAGVRTAIGLASANLDTQIGTLATAANLSTVAGYLDTEIAAILADTNELQTDWANGGRLDLLVDSIIADLPTRITKNTALAGFTFFMVDSSDHVTGKTGLTITATRSLDGAAFASCTNSASEIGNGWYKIDLAAGDLNGNTVALRFTGTAADSRNITLITQPT